MKRNFSLKFLVLLAGINLSLLFWQLFRAGFSKVFNFDGLAIIPELILYGLTIVLSVYFLTKHRDIYEGKEKRFVIIFGVLNLMFLLLSLTGVWQKYFELQNFLSNY